MLPKDQTYFVHVTINGKVYHIIIDNGITDNLILEKATQKLGLTLEHHPKPYIVR